MKTFLKILTYISAAFSLMPFLKPQDRSQKTLLWVPKLLAGAFSPIHGIICGLGALLGLVRRDWKLASAGLIGVGLTARFIEDVPRSELAFAQAFGADWQANIPAWLAPKLLPVRFALPIPDTSRARFPYVAASGPSCERVPSPKMIFVGLWNTKSFMGLRPQSWRRGNVLAAAGQECRALIRDCSNTTASSNTPVIIWLYQGGRLMRRWLMMFGMTARISTP